MGLNETVDFLLYRQRNKSVYGFILILFLFSLYDVKLRCTERHADNLSTNNRFRPPKVIFEDKMSNVLWNYQLFKSCLC